MWLAAVGAAAVLIGLVLLVRRRRRGAGGLASVGDDVVADIQKRSRRGDYAGAAERLLGLGQVRQAMELFERAGAWERASRCAERIKEYRRAGQLAERSQQLRRAADLFRQGGDYIDSARIYEQLGQFLLAAETLEQQDDPEYLRLARLWENAFVDTVPSQGVALRKAEYEMLQRCATHAAQAYEEAGELERATHFYEIGGRYDLGARLRRDLPAGAMTELDLARDRLFDRLQASIEAAQDWSGSIPRLRLTTETTAGEAVSGPAGESGVELGGAAAQLDPVSRSGTFGTARPQTNPRLPEVSPRPPDAVPPLAEASGGVMGSGTYRMVRQPTASRSAVAPEEEREESPPGAILKGGRPATAPRQPPLPDAAEGFRTRTPTQPRAIAPPPSRPREGTASSGVHRALPGGRSPSPPTGAQRALLPPAARTPAAPAPPRPAGPTGSGPAVRSEPAAKEAPPVAPAPDPVAPTAPVPPAPVATAPVPPGPVPPAAARKLPTGQRPVVRMEPITLQGLPGTLPTLLRPSAERSEPPVAEPVPAALPKAAQGAGDAQPLPSVDHSSERVPVPDPTTRRVTEVRRAAGRFKIISLIGEGGLGVVYRAADAETNGDVALKFLPAEVGMSPRLLDIFDELATTLARLQHPHIIRVLGHGVLDKRPYVATELVTGTTAADLLRVHPGGLSVLDALHLADGLLAALSYAHAQKVLHLDIRPANIFQTLEGFVKVGDFSLPLLADPGRTTQISVPPPHMAPEQALGRAVGPTADIYSAGATLFELLTGAPPFEGRPRLPGQAAPSVRSAAASVPKRLDDLIRQCLAEDPERRPPTADALLQVVRTMRRRVASFLGAAAADDDSSFDRSTIEEVAREATLPPEVRSLLQDYLKER